MSYGLCIPASGADDTAALQTAIDRIRSDNGGRIWLENKEYKVGALNCTNLSGLEIVGMPNTRIHPVLMGSPAPVFNFTSSSNWALRNLEIFCSGPHAVWPTYAVYAQDQDKVVIDRVRTPGKWTAAGVGIVGVHTVALRDCQISNFDSAAPAMLTSSLSGRYTSDVLSSCCEYHVAAGVTYTLKLNNSDNLLFLGGICDNSANAHVLTQGSVAKLSFETVKFYSELAQPSGAVILCNGPDSLAWLRIMNCSRNGIPTIDAGTGIDAATRSVQQT